MSQETLPQMNASPLVTSEMVPRYQTFESQQDRDRYDASALVGDAVHNPEARGEAVVDNSEYTGSIQHANVLSYRVSPDTSMDNGETPTFRYTITKQVSPSLEDIPGGVDVVLDGAGQILSARAYEVTKDKGIVNHELSPRDALAAASEATAVVKASNEQRKQARS